MPFLIPIAGVIVKRGPLKTTPPAGVPFEFTDEEAAKFLASPTPVVRELIDEAASLPVSASAPAAAPKGRKGKASDALDGL